MRRSAAILLMALALLLLPTGASHAGGGHAAGPGGRPVTCHKRHRSSHDTVVFDFPWWDAAYPYFYVYGDDAELEVVDPSTIAEESPAYQRQPEFWLYCPSAKAYYPKIKECRDPWMKIPPPPQ